MTAAIHHISDYRAPAHLPLALTSRANWLVWRLVQKPGEKKPRKVPFYASGAPRGWPNGRPADGKPTEAQPNVDQCTPLDRGAMVTYERAVAACIKGHYTGLGFAVMPGDEIIALDFDNCVDLDGTIEPRIAALISDTYAEFSPSGTGIRAFMQGNLRSRKDNADGKDRRADGSRIDGKYDVEFFGTNGFVTITGNATPDTEMFGLEDTVQPLSAAASALYIERFGNDGAVTLRAVGSSDNEADLMDLPPDSLGWSMTEAREILFACDANASRSQWVNALMALHHELGGTPEGLDLADEWSQTADKYEGREDVEGRWRSFGRKSGGTITGKWLLAWRNESVKHLKYDAAAEWKTKLQQSTDEFNMREKLCPEIAKDNRLDDMGREALAQMLRDSFARLGNKYPISQCRKLVAEKRVEKQPTKSGMPDWLDGWIYVTDDDKFYRMDSDEWLTAQSFNAKFDRYQPRDEHGQILQPANLAALRDHEIATVTRAVYVPWADRTFEWEGIQCVNSYRPSSVPEAAASMTADGRRAIDVIMAHLSLLAGKREAVVQTLLDWIAHQVQRPGVKVRWAPVIKGVEGDGKTVIGGLLAAVMGRVNVRNVSSKVLGTDFTSWAQGAAVVMLEEIKLTGHNRYDIMNALKPFITNDSVEIHPKGKDAFDSMNTTNYGAFTNHGDALPIDDKDRRWYVVFTPWGTVEAMEAVVEAEFPGMSLGAYFDRLFDTIQSNAAELRRWLLDHPISDAFKPNGRAPMTAEKKVMVGLSVSEEEATVREILEKGGVGITPDLFLSARVYNEMITSNADITLQTSAWSALLKRMGFTRQPKKIKWQGRAESVWVRGHEFMEPAEIRAVLARTLPEGQSEDDPVAESDLF